MASNSPATFEITATSSGGGTVIKFAGTLDETFDSKKFIEAAKGIVVVDFDAVRRITSYGVREWTRALKASAPDYCCFVRCRPAIVSQFNMVANFGGTGQLLSFYVPFVCDHCDKDIERLIDLRKEHEALKSFAPPQVACDTCGRPAEFDDIPEAYFSFVASVPPPAPPALVESLIDGTSAKAAKQVRVKKEVEGNITILKFAGRLDETAQFKRVVDGLEGNVLVNLDQIDGFDDKGVQTLATLLQRANVAMYIAGPTHQLVTALRNVGLGERVKLISVKMKFECVECKAEQYQDVTAQLAASMRHDRLRCATCGKQTLAMADAERLPAIAHPPQEISEYLVAEQQKTKAHAKFDDTPAGGGEPFGRYELLRVLGAGGMAEAYLARQRGLGGFEKHVVVKRLLPHLSADHSFISMLLEEARVAARISHPNVVQIFDLGQVENRYFIAMEYIRGKDLSSILRAAARLNQQLPIELAARMTSDICAGLQAAHTCTDESGKPFPIIHRDVSPHNVLVSIEGRVVLTDFGIAKAVDSAAQTPTSLLKGKLAYLAPEQLQLDGRPIDPRADLFPAGLIMYQLLTLEHMFRRDTEYATLKAILHDPIIPVEKKRAEVPPELSRILLKALERNPDNRYETAHEFHSDLEAFLKNFPKPSGAAEVAAWVNDLLQKESELPAEQGLTPRGDSGRDQMPTAEFRDPRSV